MPCLSCAIWRIAVPFSELDDNQKHGGPMAVGKSSFQTRTIGHLPGNDQLAIRQSVDFGDKLEAFDVLSEFDGAEGRLRYRAQDLGDDDKSMQIIAEGVREYLDAAYQMMLSDPKAQLNIGEGLDLDDLFLDRDWTSFVSPDDLQTPSVTISDVRLIGKSSDDEWLVRFHYANGPNSGHELEFADLKRAGLK
jgi:hypothetical protein